jgi:DNA-binding CsgD family transcriptional regulator
MTTTLTSRELEILQLIVAEYTTAEIAQKLNLSKETVKTHRKNLLDKFQVRNVAGLVRYAFEFNFVAD